MGVRGDQKKQAHEHHNRCGQVPGNLSALGRFSLNLTQWSYFLVIAELEYSSSPTRNPPKSGSFPANPLAPSTQDVINRSSAPSTVAAASESSSDHALMLAVRDGNLDALGELFERHHGRLFGFLVKLCGNRPAAEDLTQTVFQRMLKYRHTYRDDGSFTAWMYHLARRCAADHFRRTNAAPRATDPADLTQHADHAPHAAHHASTRDDHALLHAALGELEEGEREVLLLARFQELSFAEIASILGCSVGAAKVRAHRAVHALRDAFFKLQSVSR
jgi:RNA polymerase sigma factor (sigma-70 family)